MKSLEDYIQLSGPLFEAVQLQRIFPDQKTFVDATPIDDPVKILEKYQREKQNPDFDLSRFIACYFELPEVKLLKQELPEKDMETYLQKMSDFLFHNMTPKSPYSTLLPLPHPHPVPGERFREGFYWDSYFVAIGLVAEKKKSRIVHIVENFGSLIERFGLIPNGNRVYFLSRSQPPFFSSLLDLLIQNGQKDPAISHFTNLETEYLFWMSGMGQISPKNPAHAHVVQVRSDLTLNRYWDRLHTPRPEAFAQEVEIGGLVEPSEFYRERRAVCASGWDFSSRWFGDFKNPKTLCPLALLPVDLNALIYHTEKTLALLADCIGNAEKREYYQKLAEKRRAAIQTLFWDEKKKFFFDIHWKTKTLSPHWSLAGVVPLFVKAATERQAHLVAKALKKKFLFPGGLVTTLQTTTHQWDAPNGWAPLQWMAIEGLLHYGHRALAQKIARCWLNLNEAIYKKTHHMLEKYNVCECSKSVTDGLYATQKGFGWTNGVALALLNLPLMQS